MFSALIAECLGTLIFFSCILSYGDPIPIAVGLLAAIYAFGKVSGGHFNCAVSFMMYLKGDINGQTFFMYVIAQLVGALLALMWWRSLQKGSGGGSIKK
jgi:glycerol uptake facilitator-like aquaporin